MRLFILRLCLFFILLAGINQVMGELMVDGWQNEQYYAKQTVFLDDYASQCNTLFFGSSRTYRHLNAILFDSLNRANGLHTDTYVLASSSVFFNETTFLLDNLIARKVLPGKVRYVFIELNDNIHISDRNLFTPRASYFIRWYNVITYVRQVWAHPARHSRLKGTYHYLMSWVVQVFRSGEGRIRLKHLQTNKRLLAVRPAAHKTRGYSPLCIDCEAARSARYRKRRELLLQDTAQIQRLFDRLQTLRSKPAPNPNAIVLAKYLSIAAALHEDNIRVLYFMSLNRSVSAHLNALYHALPPGNRFDITDTEQFEQLNQLKYWFDRRPSE